LNFKSFTSKFLESIAETINSLNKEVNPSFFNPTIAMLSALILTGTAAFSYNLKLQFLIFSLSVLLVLLTRSPIYQWIKLLIFILIWAIIVSIPLLFITHGEPLVSFLLGPIKLRLSQEGFNVMIKFISRVVTSTAIFTSFITIMGWKNIINGLEGLKLPQELIFLINVFIINIPLFLKETSKMLFVREARIMRKSSFKELWIVLATVVGDILLRSYEHAWRLEKAIKARNFNSKFLKKPITMLIGVKESFLLSIVILILLLGILDWV